MLTARAPSSATSHLGAGPVLTDHPHLVRALAQVKAAAAAANCETGAIEPEVAADLLSSTDVLLAHPERAPKVALFLGGGGVAVNAAMNDWLGAPAANVSQSTADVLHTAARIGLIVALQPVTASMETLAGELRHAATRWADLAPTTLARTCLRDGIAVPTSVWPVGMADAIARAIDAVNGASASLHQVVLGATVIGTGTGATLAYRKAVVPILARRTGLPLVPHPRPASALQHGDDLLAVSSALASAARVIARTASDLRLLASGPAGGFGELVLRATGDGSTFFAGKTNPIGAETAIILAAQVQGIHATNETLALHGELHLNVFDLPVAVNLFTASQFVAAGSHALTSLIGATDIDAQRCADLASAAHPRKESPI